MSKRFIRISFPIILLVSLYLLGPQPESPQWASDVPVVPEDPIALEAHILKKENQHKIKPDNEARIVWADSTKKKTTYSVIYLHGFSASPQEGNPVHIRFAEEFGCNLYLARMADHGIDTVDALINFTADRWWASAKEALAIGKSIGEKVIVMSTSSGGTMGLALAADFPDDVYALINMSPNIAINHELAFLLNSPWGLQIGRLVKGGKYNEWDAPEERKQYWYTKYRMEAPVQLQEMIKSKMKKETFSKITQPCLTLYYYKNEKEQDPEVKVSAMLEMMDQLSTSPEKKRAVAIPNAEAHVIGSSLVSKDVEGVYNEIKKFAIGVLNMEPAEVLINDD